MRAILPALAVGLVTLSGGFQSVSAMQAPTPVATPSPYSYADIADLATIAPMAIHGRIYRATPLKAEQAPGLKAGQARLYIEADVVGLIRGSGPLAARINYLVDLPLDANGFHVPGTLPGEGETQLFLDTKTGEPVSITILTSPDGSRRWAAAFGEIVDGTAAVPARDTLAWYRLACGLPRTLPLAKLGGTAPEDRKKAASDYGVVLGALGDCTRTRTPPVGS